MFSVFLACRVKTKAWADPQLALHDWKLACNCRVQRRKLDVLDTLSQYIFDLFNLTHSRNIDVIFLTLHCKPGRNQIELDFCSCTPNDQVRLLLAGYIGGSAQRPETAISIRLVRTFHTLWKWCILRYASFSEAWNEILDPAFPSFIHTQDKQITQWNRQLSQAVDAYRAMLTMEEATTVDALKLEEVDQLACICPPCFGPGIKSLPNGEPDIVVCIDCNFQQRRHLAASVEKTLPVTPSLFIPPEQLESMRQSIDSNPTQADSGEMVDPCTDQHTAANDIRGKKDWKGNDDTGLAGMACRHDQILRFINIVQSGEKCIYPLTLINWILKETQGLENENEDEATGKKIAILYDIGCNIQKGIERRNQFVEERDQDRLMFGTSLFHSYVHEWSCQLLYNPRLNEGWGLSDGEGLERIWSLLAVLVGILRYSTKQHRLTALNFLAMHINEKGRAHSVKFILARLTKATRQLEETKFELRRLAQKRGWNLLYFQHQWARKRNAQLEVISKKRKKYLEELAELLDLEERLVDAEAKFQDLQRRKWRSQRHRRQKRKVLATPLSLVHLEEAIARLTQKIGSPEFCGLDRPGDAKAQGLVKILLAKTKVYEAKVGVIEHRRRSGEKRGYIGTNIQQYLIRLRTAKNAELRKKLATYLRHAEQYNNQFHPDPSIPTPTLQELEQMEFGDPFLDCGSLTHPQEAWAVDSDTQEGVQLYLTNARCKEELRRLTKEARQMVHWAIQYQGRLDTLAKEIHEQSEFFFVFFLKDV
ncbi:hypothetical protein DFH28DRAFT_1049759 [Melampsora americana]|nr:hypothetical protein DFH28DRAFT_1049759 [Melampsora americana]